MRLCTGVMDMLNAYEWSKHGKSTKLSPGPLTLRGNPAIFDGSMTKRRRQRRIQIIVLLFAIAVFALGFIFCVYALSAHAPAQAGQPVPGSSSLNNLADTLFVLGLPLAAVFLLGQFVSLRQIGARIRR